MPPIALPSLGLAGEGSSPQRTETKEIASRETSGEPSRASWPLVGFKRVPEGGLRSIDQEVMDKQKGVVLELLKSGGRALWEGKGIVGISLPVRIFEPKSLLQRLAEGWGLGPVFLARAAAADGIQERFKYAITFGLASLHAGCCPLKPFNPILGETYQARWPDGSNLFFEHTSHHPPIAHYCVCGPNNIFTLHGYFEFKGQLKGNYAFAYQEGPCMLDFPDGGRIEWTMPAIKISGLIWGHRLYEWIDNMEFVDKQNNLSCTLQLAASAATSSAADSHTTTTTSMYAASSSGCSSGVVASGPITATGGGGGTASRMSMFVGRAGGAKPASDSVYGEILKSGVEVVGRVEGSWLDELRFDGVRYWSLCDYEPAKPEPVDLSEVLPSDCRFREDALYLQIGAE
eukprot:GHVS01094692.1.p1 GENE.GHVS01094692.1~~GHVS01094692.1.p1  ORF type:complete len:458 (-),score=88.58 GHVS01094692.1:16-1221(-)